MKRIITYLIFILAVLTNCLLPTAYSQSIAPSLIGSTGNFSSNGTIQISSSVGEPIVTTVSSPSLTLTQGFQQVFLTCPTTATLSVTPATSPVCEGTNVTIGVVTAGGIGPFTYVWSSGQTTTSTSIVVVPTVTTTYSFSIVGCSNTGAFTETVTPTPTVTATSSSPVCSGAVLSLSANLIAGATYAWAGPNSFSSAAQNPNIPSATTADAGTYSVTATASGCNSAVATVSVTINSIPVPLITAAPSLTICSGTSATLTASGGTNYFWSSGGSVNPAVVSPGIPTTYSVNVSNGTCSVVATADVYLQPKPTITISGGAALCAGQSTTLDAAASTGAPFTYNWSPAAGLSSTNISNPVASPTITTDYSVTVTNSGGCTALATASVTINQSPAASVTATDPLCKGDFNGTATVNPSGGSPPYSYAWSVGGTTSAISNLGGSASPVTVTVTASGCVSTGTVLITDPPLLTAGITTTIQPLCGCNGQLGVTANGGTGTFTYLWNSIPAQNTALATGLCGGSHSVTISDANSCSVIATATLSPSPGVSVTATYPGTICAGNSTTIGVDALGLNLSYSWSPAAANSATVTVSPPGTITYTVFITSSASGCTDTAFVPVIVSPTPTVGVSGSTAVCSGQSATLGAAGAATYQWMPGGQTGTPIITSALTVPTTFTVTGTSAAGCSDTAIISVAVTPTPNAVANASPATICTGGVSTLTASGGTNYVWNPGGQSTSAYITPPLTSTGTFTVIVSNGSCADTAFASVTVTNFVALITTNDSDLCVGESTVLTASAGASYLWTPGNLTSQSVTVSPTSPTTYVVTIVSGACTGTDSIFVNVNSVPVPGISSSASTVCQNAPVVLTATGGTNYLWNPGGQTSASITVNPPVPGSNTYSVNVSNGSCSADTSITIFANPLPNISATANPGSICPGDSAVLTASSTTSGVSFSWPALGASTAVTTVTPGSTTTYTVVATDQNSCSNSATATVNVDVLLVSAGADMTVCPGFTANLSAIIISGSTSGLTYLWSPDTLVDHPGDQNTSANPTDSLTQFIVYVTNGSCSTSDTVQVFAIRDPSCVIHVYNGITPNADHENGSWHIDGIEGYPENRVQLFNRWGTRVWDGTGYDNRSVLWKGTDQKGRELPDGTYYYIIELFDGQGGIIYSESKWVEVTH